MRPIRQARNLIRQIRPAHRCNVDRCTHLDFLASLDTAQDLLVGGTGIKGHMDERHRPKPSRLSRGPRGQNIGSACLQRQSMPCGGLATASELVSRAGAPASRMWQLSECARARCCLKLKPDVHLPVQEAIMKTMSYREFRAHYAEVLDGVTNDREEVVITRAGARSRRHRLP